MSESTQQMLIWATFLAVAVLAAAGLIGTITLNWQQNDAKAKIACIEGGGIYSGAGVCTWSQP